MVSGYSSTTSVCRIIGLCVVSAIGGAIGASYMPVVAGQCTALCASVVGAIAGIWK